jgi:hypothetical protein
VATLRPVAAEDAMAGRGERWRCAALGPEPTSIALPAFHHLTDVAPAAGIPESEALASLGAAAFVVDGRPVPPGPAPQP